MSLQLIAKQMEAKGRGGDSMLVHMTPGEVAGLQKLAEAAGGSLSVNPETGLVEANFLKRIIENGNLLPSLVGGTVGLATMNPYAGAAAGAAVGGMQAKRNDQDVFLGAGLGAVSGFGAGSVGSGLAAAGSQAAQAGAMQTVAADQAAQQAVQQTIQNTAAQQAVQNAGQAEAANMLTLGSDQAAQAAFNAQQQELGAQAIQQAADAEAKRFAAQGLGDQASQGISALMDQGSNVGRDAFMSKVGGGAGLASDIGMAAAAPMMAPGKKPGEAPVDDEMYSYTYDVGRTGAERTPSASSAERQYFAGSYSPLRKIKASQYGAAQGGLMSLAEGGSTAPATVAAPSGISSEGMTGASKAAFDYLMGRADTAAFAGQGIGGVGGSFSGGDGMYFFDPATGQFTRNPNYVDPEELERQRREAEAAAAAAAAAAQSSGGGGDYEPLNVNYPSSGDYPYQPGDVIPNTPDVYSTPYDGRMTPLEGTPLGEPGGGGWNDPSLDGMTESQVAESGGGVGAAQGGLLGLAKGGMASGGFVVPADVVSALGNGSTDAGLRKLHAMLGKINPIKGKGDGLSDSIPTHIDGKQRAKVADGEAYIDPKTVKRVGGAKKLYAMMNKIRAQAHGKTSQQRPVNPAKVMA